MRLKDYPERSTSDAYPDLLLSTVTMGSYGMFQRHMCCQCLESSFLNYPDGLCLDCQNADARSARRTLFKHLGATHNIPDSFFFALGPYLQPMHNAKAEFRRLYLSKLLLGPQNIRQRFQLLTHFGNGKDGNISDNEDIIDRVLDFVCGVGALTNIH